MKPIPPQLAGPFELKNGSQRQQSKDVSPPLRATSTKAGKCTVVSLEERRRNSMSTGAPTSLRTDVNTAEDLMGEDGRPAAEPPNRNYDCKHYETCLDLAASLNWSSFTCQGCSGEVNSALLWRAHQNQRKDSVAKALCDLKPIEKVSGLKPSVECEPSAESEPSGHDSKHPEPTLSAKPHLPK
jgi:hypothetical protein